ncbi:hypothetical protein KY304_00095 [Candidatus Woesearchaeota archaeon]|nr:hypothetical protein [Candidatus Woesearchaeota archaeon]MBW2978497.1 hypothetical protein [Candidatus Woesearchaeota archaeon]
MSRRSKLGADFGYNKSGSLIKWIVIIIIILAIVWYLNNQGYISIPWF